MQSALYKKFLNIKSPILITGATGTGKSFLALQIFNESIIFKPKFLTMHLASLKEDLLESELFGHKKGSFSGAIENRLGYLAEVGEGTLFLDEVGELSLESQKKLLYLLEEKKFTPIGSNLPSHFKGRIIMATNRDLESLVKQKMFREDLYYRIKTFQIKLPNLTENQSELRGLIDELLNKLKIEHSQPYAELANTTREYLLHREWKGNIRELKLALEYALLMSEKNLIQIRDFPSFSEEKTMALPQNFESLIESLSDDYNESLELFERMYLRSRFEKYQGKINKTARILGLSKTTLISKARKYQINTLRLRADALKDAA